MSYEQGRIETSAMRSRVLWGAGIVLLVLGAVLIWAGCGLPGTTGHDGSLSLTLLCVGMGFAGMNFGSQLTYVSTGKPISLFWMVWPAVVGGIIGLGFSFAGLIMRTNLSLGW